TDLVAPVPVTIVAAPTNDPPVIPGPMTLFGAAINTPYTVTYQNLLNASLAYDPDGPTTISFKVTAVSNGSLLKNGQPVVLSTTTIGPGETWTWVPPLSF